MYAREDPVFLTQRGRRVGSNRMPAEYPQIVFATGSNPTGSRVFLFLYPQTVSATGSTGSRVWEPRPPSLVPEGMRLP